MKKIMFKIYSADPSQDINVYRLLSGGGFSGTARTLLVEELGHTSEIAFGRFDYLSAVGLREVGHSNDRYRRLSE